MNRALLNKLRKLTGERCDYCRMPERFDPLPFQVDHIIARQHGGATIFGEPGLELSSLQPAQGA
ncbi:MAG TPA: HNH endonuclease signature motif containing protein [Pirellulales bacterium]|nr:HNH endonuclease signature motif containing protein [Pirellulales bacterium]